MTIYIVLEAWSSDPFDVHKVFASEELASAYITKQFQDADDYKQSHRQLAIEKHELLTALD